MEYTSLDKLCLDLDCAAIHAEPMSKHTTFKVGGKADRFITVNTKAALAEIIKNLHENKTPYYVLGNGSNVLVSDSGYKGVVLMLAGDFKKIKLTDSCAVKCGAGASLASVCAFARDNSLTGLEFAWGIPATAGGAAYMNAGAYGGEMKDVLSSCRHITDCGEKGEFKGEGLMLSYRHSVYSDSHSIITDITLDLQKGVETEISAKMDDFMSRRKSKQPLEFPSAGSTFKRPEGYFAAALIEECGLKGKCFGGASVSEKHSGFVINKGGATCEDILKLIDIVKDTVYKEKGVKLECEVKMLR